MSRTESMYFRPLMVLWSIEIPFPTKNDSRCLQNVEKPINYAKKIYSECNAVRVAQAQTKTNILLYYWVLL